MDLENQKSISPEPRKTIKNLVPIKPTSNIFGVLLKKTGNSFLSNAKEEKKKVDVIVSNLFKDKVDELKKLRENIISMSPKTVSSRSNII
jgi:hypothetical protein